MIDIKKIRENPDFFRKATADKQRDPGLVDEVLKIDGEKRAIQQKVETLRAERNKQSLLLRNKQSLLLRNKQSLLLRNKQSLLLRNKIGKDGIERGKEIKKERDRLEDQLIKLGGKLEEILKKLPNPALPDVPVGENKNENVEVKKWGEILKFDFPVKSHFELGETLDIIDTQAASKVSGSRFGYLKNEGVLLEMALFDFGLKTLISRGFIPILPPVMIKKEIMEALGYNNYGFEDTYCLEEDGLCLVATAEHAIVPYLKDEALQEKDLPKRFAGISSAFRKEAGSWGKDTKGILRMHQFDKLEMVSFVKPEDSEKEHQFLVSIEEELMQALKLPYHLVQMCTGDLGDPAAAKYDIEAWFPSENKYRETHSASNCTDYQSRRLNIRFRDQNNEMEFVHILNGTVFSQRPILAILENYQQEDGSVVIPEVLRDYIGKDKISPKS